MARDEPMVSREATAQGYEPSDVRASRVWWVAAGLIALVLAFAAALWAMTEWFGRIDTQPPASAVERTDLVPPEPRLQPDPASDLESLRARETRLLSTYGWIDRETGIARIPIERAMRVLERRGWPRPNDHGT